MVRWNAVATVLRANEESSELGHIASFQSAATLYEVDFQHFWHGPSDGHGGDLVFIQGHSSPGIYARAFLEGRLTEEQLLRLRQEVDGGGLSSYPHPWLMPDFWQFPTVSMGLGPLNAPELAILGVVCSKTAPAWTGDSFEPRLVLPVSLSYDHRVIDDALAARFTRHLCPQTRIRAALELGWVTVHCGPRVHAGAALSSKWNQVLPVGPIRCTHGAAKPQAVILRMGELWPLNPRVRGSSPWRRTR